MAETDGVFIWHRNSIVGTAPIGRINDWHWMDGTKKDTVCWIEPICLVCKRLITGSTNDFKCRTDQCPAKYLNSPTKRWINDNIKRFDPKGNYK